jgi:hypothetical protein
MRMKRGSMMAPNLRSARATLAVLCLATLACSGGAGPAGPDEPPASGNFTISTSALTFGPADIEQPIRLENRGSEPASWRAETSTTWLSVSPSSGALPAGETTALVRVERTGLALGSHAGEVKFFVDDARFTVAISAEHAGQALAGIEPATPALGEDDPSTAVQVSNAGNAPLTWSMAGGPAWLAVSPATGTVPPGGSQSVTLTPDRSGLADGTQEANLTLTSNGGTIGVVVSVRVASPAKIRLFPRSIDFGKTNKVFTVSLNNDGGRPLTWSAAADAGWAEASPSTGVVKPHSMKPVVIEVSRTGLAPGDHATTLRMTSNGGTAELAVRLVVAGSSPPPPPPPPPPPDSTIALNGRVLDQFTGSGVGGLTVEFAGETSTTDATGHFSIPGQPSSSLRALEISGSTVHRRRTYARSSHTSWDAIPASFDMPAFNDVAREYEPRTIRWLQNPNVYIDTTPHNFPGGGPVPPEWIAEIQGAVAARIAEWSDGEINPGSVTVGTAPPPEGTPGTIVIVFDEDPGRYPSAFSVGLARTFWSSSRAISSSRIWLRFGGIGDAGTRRAIFAHELGHAFGMGHMGGSTASIMTPVVSSPSLTTFDLKAGDIVYGRSPGNSSPDTDDAATFVGGLVPAGLPAGSYYWVCGDPAYGSPETTPIR